MKAGGFATWGLVKNGRCMKHGTLVGTSRLCVTCHFDDLERAGSLSAPSKRQPEGKGTE